MTTKLSTGPSSDNNEKTTNNDLINLNDISQFKNIAKNSYNKLVGKSKFSGITSRLGI
ncbi:MAG: hypothetical protein Q9M94_04720 [Candidatus Gracilibacteria bacterium]|nr:hypothetical protein [Candidatus Gracilibacteria bacterium]MDQ7023472.1 hypothetical protein [Candidatus Gracilibacteria bacterium]